MKKISLFASAMALIAMTFVSCGNAQSNDSNASDAEEAEAVIENVDVVIEDNTEAGGDCCKDSCSECTKDECAKADECVKAPEASVIELTDDSAIRPDTKVKALTILDFNATWCVPCKKLTPAFHKAAEEFKGKVNFYNVDIDKNPKTAEAFGVQSVPTVVFITPAGKVDTYVGLNPFLGESGSTDADNIFANLSKMIDKAK